MTTPSPSAIYCQLQDDTRSAVDPLLCKGAWLHVAIDAPPARGPVVVVPGIDGGDVSGVLLGVFTPAGGMRYEV